jgi:uncharacterized paraquat-inducible protein A
MFDVDLSLAFVLYPVIGLVAVAGLWLYFDRRDRQFFDRTRRKTTFHCLKCDHVYSHAGPGELCPCPRCGHENPRLHF